MSKDIKEALTRMGLEAYLTHCIVYLLRTRIIQSALRGNHLTRAVSRDSPNGGTISPVLYADDLVILVSEVFPSIMSEIMEGALEKICLWIVRCGLGGNLIQSHRAGSGLLGNTSTFARDSLTHGINFLKYLVHLPTLRD